MRKNGLSCSKDIGDSQQLKSLARNPLLCAMLCALNHMNNEQLPEEKMELDFECFDRFSKLRKIILDVNEDLAWEIMERETEWKGCRDDLEIVTCNRPPYKEEEMFFEYEGDF